MTKKQKYKRFEPSEMKAKFKFEQLLAATLCSLLALPAVAVAVAAAIEAQPGNSYGASFISNPAIYAYTVANQQQQQQQRQNPDNQNFINFDAGNSNANVNGNYRNYYYTDANATPTLNTPAASAAPAAATQPAPLTGCTLDRLAVYKVVLHTYWTRELFPKHYPDWRPTAQWTKTLGKCTQYLCFHFSMCTLFALIRSSS